MAETTIMTLTVDTEIMKKAERALMREDSTIEETMNAILKFIAETGSCPPLAKREHRMIDPETMTDEEIAAEIQKGLDDIEAGRVVTLEESKRHIERLRRAWEGTV